MKLQQDGLSLQVLFYCGDAVAFGLSCSLTAP